MAGTSKTSCFDRWKSKHPFGTYEQFQKEYANFRKGKDFSPPKVIPLPDGSLTSVKGLTPSDIASMAQEHAKTAATNQ